MKFGFVFCLFCLAVSGAILFAGCDVSLAGRWEYKEVTRIKSPGGKVEAVLLQGSSGATTPTTSLVVLVQTGGKVDTRNPEKYASVFRADHLKNLSLLWKQGLVLAIQYEEAIIIDFKNLWEFQTGEHTFSGLKCAWLRQNRTFQYL